MQREKAEWKNWKRKLRRNALSRKKERRRRRRRKRVGSKLDFHPEPITLIKAENCERVARHEWTIRTSHRSRSTAELCTISTERTVRRHTLISSPTSLYPVHRGELAWKREATCKRARLRGHVRYLGDGDHQLLSASSNTVRWTRDNVRAPSNCVKRVEMESRSGSVRRWSGRNCVNIFRNDSLGRFDGGISGYESTIRLARAFDYPLLWFPREKGRKDDDSGSLERVVTLDTSPLLSRSNFVGRIVWNATRFSTALSLSVKVSTLRNELPFGKELFSFLHACRTFWNATAM